MNKKGQSLIIFVLILPLIIFFIALFIDSSMMLLENNRMKEIVKDNIKISLNDEIRDIYKIQNVIEKNGDIKATVIINDDELKVEARSEKKAIFGNLFKIKWLEQKINYCGSYENKIINKCVE